MKLKYFVLYFIFPLIPVADELIRGETLIIVEGLFTYIIAFVINAIFMKLIGERLFTYRGNKAEY